MPRETARVTLEKGTLRVEVPKNSPLLGGIHRVFFVNVLGFESSEDFAGYSMRGDGSQPRLLAEVVDYLREQQIEPDLNASAQTAAQRHQDQANDLDAARLAGRAIKSTPPRAVVVPSLRRPLKPYQVPAVAHAIAVKNAANFSVPGSGKTAVVLSVFAILRARKELDKIVVIGPRSSFMPWEEEFYACFLRKPRSIRISGSRRDRLRLFRLADAKELVLLTYQMANNDQGNLISLLQRHRTLLVLDESHNIKRLEGGTWATAVIDIGTHANRRMILTGTPAPHSATDLWSQMSFLWPNPPVLGSKDQFKYRVEREDTQSLQRLREELFPLYWRIRKRDLHLPRPRFHRIPLKLRPYQRAIYTVLAAKVLSEVVKAPTERTRLRLWRKARMVRLLQAASNPALLTQYSTEFQVPPLSAAGLSVDQLIENYHQYETPVKLDFAVKLARQLTKKGQKVLIWSAFVHNIRTVERALSDLHPRIIYGDVPKDENEDLEFNREKMIHDFRTSSRYPILIANPSACAESVSLHKVCLHAIYLDRTFNGAHYMQSLDRIHRVGMKPGDKVHYYLLQSEETIDAVIDQRLEEKQGRMLKLLDEDFSIMSLEYAAGEFSEETEEGRDYVALVEHLRRDVQATGV
jgi:SNF2 family DNA or RNA helicase